MKLGGISLKLLLGHVLLVVLSLGVLAYWMIDVAESRFDRRISGELLALAQAVSQQASDVASNDGPQLRRLLAPQQAAGAPGVIVTAQGAVLAHTSELSPAEAAALPAPAELQRAAAMPVAQSRRRLSPEEPWSLIVAVRGRTRDDLPCVVWLARRGGHMLDTHSSGLLLAGVIALIAFVATMILALGATRLWVRPMQQLAAAARQLSEGDLEVRAEAAGSGELALLARALNDVRRRLAAQATTLDNQRLTLESLLNQLKEGVVVTRPDGRVALMNPAAIELLNLHIGRRPDPAVFIGRLYEECIPQHDLQEMLHVPPSAGPADSDGQDDYKEIRLQVEHDDRLAHLRARASTLQLPAPPGDARRTQPGRLLVLTDISELIRTVQVKTDFAANASHELRTPLSTIRLAVESLLNMDLSRESADAQHFIGLIDRHSARLTAMVKDLLDLTRLENPGARYEVRPLAPRALLDELRDRFADAIARRGLHWEADIAADVPPTLTLSPHLIQLALDNLVENAVKFTDTDGRVCVAVRNAPGGVSFEVADTGCGIPDAEQERVFERFYQVERARSGADRGTGLGLSIVRHAVTAMNGCVTLTSTPGVGTRVTLTVPQRG
ncbi:Alkaline phosphatase synthesis sensor protein PhoR [Phycisphaerae bacterium RAS1]|nr:Alkaline phosphatase synthesis sensor protein PhoR [Phycisphaerae bacterium RAS1]